MIRYQKYDRRQSHDILEPETRYTHQAGTWGLQGIIQIKNSNDFVFFVTQGLVDDNLDYGDILFDNGTLHWKTQNRHNQSSSIFRTLLNHNDQVNKIYFMYRLSAFLNDKSYVYIGELEYIDYDKNTNNPVHMTWKVKDWSKDAVEKALQVSLQSEFEINLARNTIKNEEATDPKNIDFDKMYEKNKELGILGEEAVFKEEKRKLIEFDKKELAELVSITSNTIGNSAPFDIESRFLDGSIKHIEVKTTSGKNTANFFISAAELEFAKSHLETYFLYRLYNFDIKNKTYEMNIYSAAELLDFEFDPIQFVSRIKK